MKIYLKVLFICLIISLALFIYVLAQEPQTEKADFTLRDLKTGVITISSYRDKQPVVLFFWTTWCPFCANELAKLNNLYPELVGTGWEVLSLNVGESEYRVDNFARRYNLSFRVLLDKDTAVTKSFGILGVPTFILLNKKGEVVFQDNYFPQDQYKELIAK